MVPGIPFDAGDHPYLTTVFRAGLDIDLEHAPETLRPEPAPDLIRDRRRPAYEGVSALFLRIKLRGARADTVDIAGALTRGPHE